jgi:hypothetical protein
MNQLILPNELNFSTKSTKGFKKLKFRNKLFVLKKKTRSFDQDVLSFKMLLALFLNFNFLNPFVDFVLKFNSFGRMS